jgi:hypothetical protein
VEWKFGGILSCFIFIVVLRFLVTCVEPVVLRLFNTAFLLFYCTHFTKCYTTLQSDTHVFNYFYTGFHKR